MFCPNCGTQNNEDAGFCANCGTSMKPTIPEMPTPIEQNVQMPVSEPIASTSIPTPVASMSSASQSMAMPTPRENVSSSSSFNFFAFIIALLLKPVSTLKEKLSAFEDIKLSAIFTSIVAGLAMLINLLTSIYKTVHVNTAGWLSEPKYEFVWDNMKNVKWVDLIFKNFFIYVGIIAVIALVYFLAGLIVKKQLKYPRLTAVVTSAFIPLVLTVMILSPIVSWISSELGLVVSIAGGIYAFTILIGGLNRELDLADEDLKVYVNVICWSVLVITAYYVMMKIIMSAITSGASDFLEGMFS